MGESLLVDSLSVVHRRLTRSLDRLLDWRDRAAQRHQLLGLSDAALKDFGASRADATRDAGKPFWRA
jgi:uncharacterized protein YjiS (DUF1127 family)